MPSLSPSSPGPARFLFVLLAGVAASACSGKKEAPPPPPAEVTAVVLEPRSARVTVEYVAETEAFNTVDIRPLVGGLIDRTEIV